MLFDYLVAIVAQKLKNLDNFKDNVIGNIFEKNLDFWKIFKFFSFFKFFSNFKETYKSEFLSYDCNQVVKKYLNYSNNSLVKIIWARAQLRARCTPKWKTQEKRIFKHFCNTGGRGCGFRARNRALNVKSPQIGLFLAKKNQHRHLSQPSFKNKHWQSKLGIVD